MGASNTRIKNFRYIQLDGLRGMCALVVVLHHCFLVSPLLAETARDPALGTSVLWAWLALFTPLHLIWAGQEAVFLFFILSGFVLTLPFDRRTPAFWRVYFPKRLVRIYLPAWCSLLVALFLAWCFPRKADPDFSWWINLHDESPNALSDAFLLWGTGSLNSPLWSLQWEMVFSLLLPLVCFLAKHCRRIWVLILAVLLLFIGVAEQSTTVSAIVLPMFGIGVLMAVKRDRLQEMAREISPPGWCVLLGASILLLCSHWIFPSSPLQFAPATLGAALMIFAFTGFQPLVAFGSLGPIHWFGVRSFSLYLVHEPIIVSISVALHTTNPFFIALTALPLSLLFSTIFFHFVERPSQRLAAKTGELFGRTNWAKKDTPLARA